MRCPRAGFALDPTQEASANVQYGAAWHTRPPSSYSTKRGPKGRRWLKFILDQPSAPKTISTSYSFDKSDFSTKYATNSQHRRMVSTSSFSRGNFGVGKGNCITSAGSVKFRPRFPASYTCGVLYWIGRSARAGPGHSPHRHALADPYDFPMSLASAVPWAANWRSQRISTAGASRTSGTHPIYQVQAVSTFLQTLCNRYKELYKCVPFRDLTCPIRTPCLVQLCWPRHSQHRCASHRILDLSEQQ